MLSIRKKNAVYGVIALMLCVAVYLNWSYVRTPDDLVVAKQTDTAEDIAIESSTQTATAEETTPAEAISKEDYFAQSRLTRQQARDEAIGILKDTAESDSADEKSKENAEQKISAMAENTVQEANIESLIKAKGYEEAVVFIGEESVNVVVKAPEGGLQATDVAILRDIVQDTITVSADQIKIVEAA